MPYLHNLTLELDADVVLRAQGADPAVLKARRPDLVADAARAIEIARPLLTPQVIYERWPVTSVRHNLLDLAGGRRLRGEFLLTHLAAASELVVILCTVGEAIEERVRATFSNDPVMGLALDAVGTAAVESLSVNATRYFEAEAAAQGMGISVPLSPGMEGWSVEEGQPQLFGLVPGESIGVRLTEHKLMRPGKSLSLVIGIGENVETQGSICDYCAVRATCRMRGSHGQVAAESISN